MNKIPHGGLVSCIVSIRLGIATGIDMLHDLSLLCMVGSVIVPNNWVTEESIKSTETHSAATSLLTFLVRCHVNLEIWLPPSVPPSLTSVLLPGSKDSFARWCNICWLYCDAKLSSLTHLLLVRLLTDCPLLHDIITAHKVGGGNQLFHEISLQLITNWS